VDRVTEPGILLSAGDRKSIKTNQHDQEYLLIAARNFWKHKVFSLINIAGLAIGISAALVIYLLVSYEFSFDKFHKDRTRIYRVVSKLNFPGQVIQNGGVCAPLSEAVQREITGLAGSAAFHLYDTDVKVVPGSPGNDNTRPFLKTRRISYLQTKIISVFFNIHGSPVLPPVRWQNLSRLYYQKAGQKYISPEKIWLLLRAVLLRIAIR
ncbi:MAG: ABC transporter permease, partial [Bacteroidota bacterium]